MKNNETIHQIAIKYLTYLVLNKRKVDNKQEPKHPPIVNEYQNNMLFKVYNIHTNKSPITTR